MINATLLLKAYGAYRLRMLNAQDPVAAQRKELLRLVSRAKNTRFGTDHAFSTVKSVEQYQKLVPLRTYEQFWSDYFKSHFPILENVSWPGRMPFFAVSSGTTTGTTKFIPYTHDMTGSNTKAGMDLLVFHVKNKPSSQIFSGKSFMLGGSTALVEQAPGVYSGDLSGIAVKTMKAWAKPWYFPPAHLALLDNWEEKIEILGKQSLREPISMLGGVPTWLLIFLDKLSGFMPTSNGKAKALFPKLEMLVHGGVPFGPYKERFDQIFAESQVDFREVYPASEGFIAVADRNLGEGMRLICDHGIFYEFVPVDQLESKNPDRLWLADVEVGIEYAVVLTTCAGLWSYVLGDTVHFVETNPPRLLVSGRTSFYLSAFGEHVIADEVEDAVSFASSNSGMKVHEYTVGALYPQRKGDLGQHLFIVESRMDASAETRAKFCELVDRRLSERNEDYMAHRAGGFGLKSPALRLAPIGSFNGWMKTRGKLGGQNKIPRIISRAELFAELNAYLDSVESL